MANPKDLPRGRTRGPWKRDFLGDVREASGAFEGLSEKQLADTIRTYRRERGKSGATVVAEVASHNAGGGDGTTRPSQGRGMNRPAHARARISEARLRQMIEEATIDAYGEGEQAVGFLTMLEEHLKVPFKTTVFDVPVIVRRVDITQADEIVAICYRGRHRQAIPILSLPVPRPTGWEWIEAYRRWAQGWRR